MELPTTRVRDDALLPTRAHDGDAGLDLYAADAATIGPGERAAVATGIAVEIPDGYAGLVLPRSGLAARHGIALVNAPGLIDSGYRGEIRVLLLNTDRVGALRGFSRRPDRPAGADPGRGRGAGRGVGARRDRSRRGRLRLERPLGEIPEPVFAVIAAIGDLLAHRTGKAPIA